MTSHPDVIRASVLLNALLVRCEVDHGRITLSCNSDHWVVVLQIGDLRYRGTGEMLVDALELVTRAEAEPGTDPFAVAAPSLESLLAGTEFEGKLGAQEAGDLAALLDAKDLEDAKHPPPPLALMTDEEAEALSAAERAGTDPGHEHCPDCGCDPEDHQSHRGSCRRVGQPVEFQCGPPWNPMPDKADVDFAQRSSQKHLEARVHSGLGSSADLAELRARESAASSAPTDVVTQEPVPAAVSSDDPSEPCCDFRDHSGSACACPDPQHEGDPMHPFAAAQYREPAPLLGSLPK